MLTHLTISVSHHDGCRLVHPAKWSFKYVIHHHDRCRFVHPAMWDILTMPYTIMTDSDWCIPPCWSFGISIRFNSRCQELTNSFTIQLITHMQLIVKHFKYHIFKSICPFVISFQRYTHSIYSFQVYLVNYQTLEI